MTAGLPAYSGPDATCPKCKAGAVPTVWHPGPVWQEKTSRGTEWLCQYAREIRPPAQRQHLCRLCGNCGFNWPEALA
jgi:hypothetical protein